MPVVNPCHLGVKASSIMSDSSRSTMSGVGLRPECCLMGECSGVAPMSAAAGGLLGSPAATSAAAGCFWMPACTAWWCQVLGLVLLEAQGPNA